MTLSLIIFMIYVLACFTNVFKLIQIILKYDNDDNEDMHYRILLMF